MTSENPLPANHGNPQNGPSSGRSPTTEDAPKRTHLNALRHPLTGQVTAMTPEDRAALDKFARAIIQSLAPDGAMELQLAHRVAADSWRLNRATAIEDNLFALGLQENAGGICPDQLEVDAALTTARVFTVESKQLQLLTLYEQRLNRGLQKNLAQLQSLQAARKLAREAGMKDAKPLLQLSELRGLEYQPAQDGFVFSNAEIHAAIDRENRLRAAARTDFSAQNRQKPRRLHAGAA